MYRQTKKTLTKSGMFYIRKDIKKESYHWYKTMREVNMNTYMNSENVLTKYWTSNKTDHIKKDIGVLKGPTDYRSASNSYPVKTLQRD